MAAFPREKNGRFAKCWARGEWKVFLDTPDDIPRVINYIEANPVKETLPPQRWEFVTHWKAAF
ncbi:hypothetical protein SH661x_001195 [Planctomicrobium sp. SH661]|uniref:hypothetical protein n=1 Tax=Planctomicrobium sp. SH661 TaxID=3448124 RepID=UPI003F5C89A4